MSEGLFPSAGDNGTSLPPSQQYDVSASSSVDAPLAIRMRPRDLSEVMGQRALLAPGAPLRRLVEGGGASSVILYGPPGTGKTTLAMLVARAAGRHFAQLSALSAGVAQVREVIATATKTLRHTGEQTVLFIDEIHRFSKTQQDSLLGAVEDRTIILIGATTENPFFSVVSPLLSRSLVLQLNPLSDDEIQQVVQLALSDERGLAGRYSIAPDALEHIVALAGGDARRALTALEAAADSAPDDEEHAITLVAVERAVDRAAVRYDRDGDQHYDVISAFIKSIRGSDVDAALHYLARMIFAGEDPRYIARRLMVHASEDIGMADPTALTAAVSAAHVVQMVGLPEARLALAQATVHLATAPKSNAVITAIDQALADVRAGKAGAIPAALRDAHYPGAKQLGAGEHYQYPHHIPEGVATQQYPPDELVGVDYYRPTSRGYEQPIAERIETLRRVIRGQ